MDTIIIIAIVGIVVVLAGLAMWRQITKAGGCACGGGSCSSKPKAPADKTPCCSDDTDKDGCSGGSCQA